MPARPCLIALLCAVSLVASTAIADSAPAPALPQLDWCTLVHVVDGDTLHLKCGDTNINARLYCIDAPEMDQAPWGAAARDQLKALVGKRVEVAVKALDRWDRPVVEILTQGEPSPGLALVAAGEVAVYPRYCSEPAYLEAEASARAAGLGIWSAEGLQRTPWVWRRHGRR